MPTFSERLNELLSERKKDGLTQASLAAYCGIERASVNEWVKGSSKSPKPENLVKTADYFGVEIRWLATGDEPKYLTQKPLSQAVQKLLNEAIEAEALGVTLEEFTVVANSLRGFSLLRRQNMSAEKPIKQVRGPHGSRHGSAPQVRKSGAAKAGSKKAQQRND